MLRLVPAVAAALQLPVVVAEDGPTAAACEPVDCPRHTYCTPPARCTYCPNVRDPGGQCKTKTVHKSCPPGPCPAADYSLGNVFQSGMVLQRDAPIRLWGHGLGPDSEIAGAGSTSEHGLVLPFFEKHMKLNCAATAPSLLLLPPVCRKPHGPRGPVDPYVHNT